MYKNCIFPKIIVFEMMSHFFSVSKINKLKSNRVHKNVSLRNCFAFMCIYNTKGIVFSLLQQNLWSISIFIT